MDTPSQAPLYRPLDAKPFFRKAIPSTRVLIIIGIIVVAIIGWTFIPRLINSYAPEGAPVPTSAALEEQWGVRITQIAVTADGGMVDMRYLVLDPTKAVNFGVDPQSTPALASYDNPTVVSLTAAMPHKDTLTPGVIYFMLYNNSNGAIKKQTYISLTIGDIRLDHFPVR